MNTRVARFRSRPFWLDAAAFFAAWVKEPSVVASICPSSPALTERIADRNFVRTASKIVDLGPGTGVTTSALLQFAPPDCKVMAIEKIPEFIIPLQNIGDPRLIVQHGDVVGLESLLQKHEMTAPDVIVSGIPFSSMPVEDATVIMSAIHRTLAEGGVFIAYQIRSHVARFAQPHFGEPDVEIVWFNLPPLRIFVWQKGHALHCVA